MCSVESFWKTGVKHAIWTVQTKDPSFSARFFLEEIYSHEPHGICIISAQWNRGQVDLVYTDDTKAFDKVHHGCLIGKLKRRGISPNIVDWFFSYLSDRSQFVVIGYSTTRNILPTSGIPRVSILGPFLFINFVNDLQSSLSDGSNLGFVDDLKVFRRISRIMTVFYFF